jgi:hypothetical protein
MQTPRGELIISGPLRNLPDLSFQDLNRNAFVKFEEGQSLIEFSKPSQDVIKREFDVNHIQLLNQIFEQDKYAALFGNNVRKTLSLNRYNDVLVCKE